MTNVTRTVRVQYGTRLQCTRKFLQYCKKLTLDFKNTRHILGRDGSQDLRCDAQGSTRRRVSAATVFGCSVGVLSAHTALCVERSAAASAVYQRAAAPRQRCIHVHRPRGGLQSAHPQRTKAAPSEERGSQCAAGEVCQAQLSGGELGQDRVCLLVDALVQRLLLVVDVAER